MDMPKFNKSAPGNFFRWFVERQKNEYLHLLNLLNQALNADLLLLAQISQGVNIAESVLVLQDGHLSDNFSYPLSGTPCDQVHKEKACFIFENVTNEFPEDLLLKELEAVGYLGFPIQCDGESIGLLVALSTSDLHNFSTSYFVAEIFAKQLSAELTGQWQKSQLGSYQQLFDEVCSMSAIGVWEYNIASNALYWSNEVYHIYDIPLDSSLTPDLAISFYSDADRERITQLFNESIETGRPYRADLQFTSASGEIKWVRTNGKVDYDIDGKPIRVFGAIIDVTDELKKFQDQKEQQYYLKGLLDSITDAVITIDSQGYILDSNKASETIFGYSAKELAKLRINALMPEPYASQHDGYLRHYQKTGDAKIMGIGRQLPAKRKNGDVFQMELSLCEYKHNQDTLYIGIVRDISARILANDSIYRLAYIDTVTGLKNRASFTKEFKSLQSESFNTQKYVYVAYLDIDGLAKINLTYGIDTANHFLKLTSQKIESVIGENFCIYRYTCDEFIITSKKGVALSNLDELNYQDLEKTLRDSKLFELTYKSESLELHASITSIVIPVKSVKQEELLDYLEFGMKQAKQHKPSGYFFLTPTTLDAYNRAKKLQSRMLNALQNDEFYIVLQPQFRFDGNLVSSEALLRWRSNDIGFISPAEFIPLAEENNYVIFIGDWVIEQVCKLLSKVYEEGIKTRISINISSKQIIQPDFERKLHSATQKYSISADSLMLELTETVLVSDIELVKMKMLSLAALGYLFSVDDFGTGYSSLNYIKELPISELKIDKCFIDGLGSEDSYSATNIVNAVIDMAKALHLEVVAEGVETQEQHEYLKKRGCDIAQGYLLSKPLSVDDWTIKIRDSK